MIVAGEDQAALLVACRVISSADVDLKTIQICAGGRTKLQAKIPELIRSCHGGLKVVVCADLDLDTCLVRTRNAWFPNGIPPRMAFSFAAREVDAWLLADPGVSRYLRSSMGAPDDPEGLQDPKAALLNIARRSASRDIRDAMVYAQGSLARVGPGYNSLLKEFIETHWSIETAAERSPSLERFRQRILALMAL